MHEAARGDREGLAGSRATLVRVAVEPDPFAELSPAKRKIADAVEKLAPRFSIEPRSRSRHRGRIQLPAGCALGRGRSRADAAHSGNGCARSTSRTRTTSPTTSAGGSRIFAGCSRTTRARSPSRSPRTTRARRPSTGTGGFLLRETRDYVRRILELYGSDRHPYDARIVTPSPVVATGVPGTS
jgi:hypothetical protein